MGRQLVGFYRHRERRWNQADFVSSSWLLAGDWDYWLMVMGVGLELSCFEG